MRAAGVANPEAFVDPYDREVQPREAEGARDVDWRLQHGQALFGKDLAEGVGRGEWRRLGHLGGGSRLFGCGG